MKLTKQQLKQIIKEELNNLHEGQFDDTVTRQADRRKSEAAQGHETLRVLLTDFDPASANLTWEDYDSLKKLLWWLDNGDTDLAKPEQQETEVATGIESDEGDDASGGEGAGDGPYSYMSRKDIDKQRYRAMKRRGEMLDMLPKGASE